MAFGFPTAGDIVPRLKFNAQSGRMLRVDREADAQGNYTNTDTDITSSLVMLVDRDSMRKGWWNFTTFTDILVRIDEPVPPCPQDIGKDGEPTFRKTVQMRVKLAPDCGGDVREFATSAGCVMDVLEYHLDVWSKGEHANDDMCPVLKLSEVEAVAGARGTYYVPTFILMGWRPRPDDMPQRAAPVEPSPQNEAPAEMPQNEPPADYVSAPVDDEDELPF